MRGILISTHRHGSLIDLWIRNENNQKRQITISDFKPYFYIESDYGEYKGIYGETLTKVYTKDPSQVRTEKTKYPKSWEADIIFTRRVLIDLGIYKGIEFPDNRQYISQDEIEPCEVNINPLILFLDIEVLPGKGFPIPEEAKQPVISFSFKTNKSNKLFTYIFQEGKTGVEREKDQTIVYFNNEKDLLIGFCDIIEKIEPDIITGYNIVDFDLLYLKNRFKNLDLKWVDERSFESFDLQAGYQKLKSITSKIPLKRVVVSEGITTEDKIKTIKEALKDYRAGGNMACFKEYASDDVKYIFELDKKHSIIDYFLNLKYLAGMENIKKTLGNSVLVDTILLRIAKERNIKLPTTVENSKNEKFQGAYVMAADAGLYEGVASFDFTSYYPNLVLSFFISPENMSEKGEISIPEFNTKFIKNEGINQIFVRYLMKEKIELSKQMEEAIPGSEIRKSLYLKRQAIKFVLNAGSYGVFAYPGFRFYNLTLAKIIASLAREGVKHGSLIAKENNYKLLLVDTDSVYAQIPFKNGKDVQEKLGKGINDYFLEKYNVKTNLNLDFERYMKYLLLPGVKKRYVMRVIHEKRKSCDYIVSKGFENVRTDQSKFTRNLLNELFDLIMYDKREEIKDFINGKLVDFIKCPLGDIGIAKGLNKPFKNYKGNIAHVRSAIWSNTYLNTNFGYKDKPMMLWVKGVGGLPTTNVMSFDEDTDLSSFEIIVDWEHMKHVCILDKVAPILDAVGISLDSSGKQITF